MAVKQSHRFASRALDGEGSLELAAGVRTLTLRVEEVQSSGRRALAAITVDL